MDRTLLVRAAEPAISRYVRIQMNEFGILHLDQVKILGACLDEQELAHQP